jgi:catalase
LGPPHSFAEVTYYPIHAYGWLDADNAPTWVRYVLQPLATDHDRLDEAFEGRDRLFEEMEARLARGPVRFDLRVTVAAEGDDPHDPMSVWKGSPGTGGREFSAGVVEIIAPVPDPEADGGLLVFDPVRVIDGITLSDDPILHYREQAYAASISRRS